VVKGERGNLGEGKKEDKVEREEKEVRKEWGGRRGKKL
jgi:hypothetical protein